MRTRFPFSTMKPFFSFCPYPGIFKKLPPSDAVLFVILVLILCVQIAVAMRYINDAFTTETPIRGGEIHEGVVGVPVYRNALLATNSVERDIAALLHAGLLRRDGTGTLVPHLAESWSRDENQFMFRIRDGAFFHDGTPVTAADVIHTVRMIGLLGGENEHHHAWNGVEVSAPDDMTVIVTVPGGALRFPEEFTAPVLPKHVWQKIPPEKWTRYRGPGVYIGAGPYMHLHETLTLNERLTTMTLGEFPGYVLGRPYIERIIFHFFGDTDELITMYRDGTVSAVTGIAANEVSTLLRQGGGRNALYAAETDRVIGVFFNMREGGILNDSFIRNILPQVVDRGEIVETVLRNRATALQSPIASDTATEPPTVALEDLQQTLEDIGWEFEASVGHREKDGVPLHISFVLPDTEETRHIGDILSERWRKLGIKVDMRILPPTVLRSAVEESQFDVLLYGYEADGPKDLVDVWKRDGRRSMASIIRYDSPDLDALLTELESDLPPERIVTALTGSADTAEAGGTSAPPAPDPAGIPADKWHAMVYTDIKEEMMRDTPGIFLYSPHFLYILPRDILGIDVKKDNTNRFNHPSDRFNTVHTWHTQKEHIWNFLVSK